MCLWPIVSDTLSDTLSDSSYSDTLSFTFTGPHPAIRSLERGHSWVHIFIKHLSESHVCVHTVWTCVFEFEWKYAKEWDIFLSVCLQTWAYFLDILGMVCVCVCMSVYVCVHRSWRSSTSYKELAVLHLWCWVVCLYQTLRLIFHHLSREPQWIFFLGSSWLSLGCYRVSIPLLQSEEVCREKETAVKRQSHPVFYFLV